MDTNKCCAFREWKMKMNVKLLWAVSLMLAGAVHADGFLMWQAQRDGKVIHLLASIDFLTPESLSVIAPEIRDAFDSCEVFVMESEMDMARQKLERRKIIAASTYPEGDNLLNHLPSATANRFNELCRQLTIQNRAFLKTKPWAAAYNLTTVAKAKLMIPLNNKMDHMFYNWAVSENKTVEFLSTPEEMIEQFDPLPEETQVQFFDKTLNDIQNMRDMTTRAEAAWRAADIESATALVEESFAGYPELRDILNRAGANDWAGKLDAQLASEEKIFALIHLRHLVGKGRLLETLKDKGFLIAQVVPE